MSLDEGSLVSSSLDVHLPPLAKCRVDIGICQLLPSSCSFFTRDITDGRRDRRLSFIGSHFEGIVEWVTGTLNIAATSLLTEEALLAYGGLFDER